MKDGSVPQPRQPQEQTDLHSIGRFNFFIYLISQELRMEKHHQQIPYTILRGYKTIRKHIDLGKMVNRFLHLERATHAILDSDQRMILHVFPKEDLRQFDAQRLGFKLRENLKGKARRSRRRRQSVIHYQVDS